MTTTYIAVNGYAMPVRFEDKNQAECAKALDHLINCLRSQDSISPELYWRDLDIAIALGQKALNNFHTLHKIDIDKDTCGIKAITPIGEAK